MSPRIDFQVAVLDQLRRAPLDPPAQLALLQVLSSTAQPCTAASARAYDMVTERHGEVPTNAAQLEFESLRRSFALRPSSLPASSVQPM